MNNQDLKKEASVLHNTIARLKGVGVIEKIDVCGLKENEWEERYKKYVEHLPVFDDTQSKGFDILSDCHTTKQISVFPESGGELILYWATQYLHLACVEDRCIPSIALEASIFDKDKMVTKKFVKECFEFAIDTKEKKEVSSRWYDHAVKVSKRTNKRVKKKGDRSPTYLSKKIMRAFIIYKCHKAFVTKYLTVAFIGKKEKENLKKKIKECREHFLGYCPVEKNGERKFVENLRKNILEKPIVKKPSRVRFNHGKSRPRPEPVKKKRKRLVSFE